MVGTNGVIHVIESVIIPSSAKTVEEELKRRNAVKFLGLLFLHFRQGYSKWIR